MRYPHLAEIYESIVEEHEELERKKDELQSAFSFLSEAFQTVFGEISKEEAERVLTEHPEFRGLL